MLDELGEFNKRVLSEYYFEKNSQHIVMPGFFNGNFILFIGQNPGLLKEKVEGDMMYIEGFNKKDLKLLEVAYEKALRNKAGTVGTFIIDIYGEDWNSISFTNVIKTPFNNNKINMENPNFHLRILKKQIELLKPKHIITVGFLAKKALQFLNIKTSLNLPHPSWLHRKGIYDKKILEYKELIDKFKEKNIKQMTLK